MQAKIIFTLAVVLASFNLVQAQGEQSATVARRMFKVNFLAPRLEYEQGITESTTININPNLGFGLGYGSSTGYDAYIFPSLGLQARKYYNLSKRFEQGKNVSYNSGNFFALSVYGNTASIIENDDAASEYSYGIGPVWGMQRNYRSGFSLTLTIGAGYGKDKFGDNGLTPLLGLNLGFLLGRGR